MATPEQKLSKLSEIELNYLVTQRARGYTAEVCYNHLYHKFPEAWKYEQGTVIKFLYQASTRDKLVKPAREALSKSYEDTSFGKPGSRIIALNTLAECTLQDVEEAPDFKSRKPRVQLFAELMKHIREEQASFGKPKGADSPVNRLIEEGKKKQQELEKELKTLAN